MPSVINQVIIPWGTELGPGGRFHSQQFDVSGTESIAVNVSISNVNPAIKRTILFGPTPNNASSPARIDTFETSNHLMTSLPTHGPKVSVVVEHTGTAPGDGANHWHCTGWIYGVRLTP